MNSTEAKTDFGRPGIDPRTGGRLELLGGAK